MTWNTAIKVAVQTVVLDQMDANGASAYLDIYDSGNVLLSTLPFEYPSGTVNGTTGQLVCVFGLRDEEAAATGTANYAKLKTATGVVLEDHIPCQAGVSPVSGYLVLSTLSIIVGAPVEGSSFTIG
jgi:hypothetical protein